jgi:hypothetical protein
MSEKQTFSAPELTPVFSFPVEGGDIYVYLVQSDVAKFTIATFDDTSSEFAYSIQTLTSNTEQVSER